MTIWRGPKMSRLSREFRHNRADGWVPALSITVAAFSLCVIAVLTADQPWSPTAAARSLAVTKGYAAIGFYIIGNIVAIAGIVAVLQDRPRGTFVHGAGIYLILAPFAAGAVVYAANALDGGTRGMLTVGAITAAPALAWLHALYFAGYLNAVLRLRDRIRR